ncbi:HAMP domain-containing histidine kinase [Enterococcus sp. 669A]|uniref:histidine kinase n=1 Tax=Candidatus Enterococcus moelleringii TaxID=2815325 RepID=A0ABS3L943_9ENTE|nr:HAMP domain-containing sensor histidine kinase [Enterococcus sp. 669A]MBO1306141.1 HAMP domain-containing histidine kinase [Enterococcus sp. 669A]
MKDLKRAILKAFVIYFFGLTITVSLLEEVSSGVISPQFPEEYRLIIMPICALLQIVSIGLFSFLFYRSLDQKITKKSQQLAKDQSTLFANIAHDLKTPLTSITGFSKALCEDIVEPEETKEVSAIIYQKSVVANELLDLMFHYTKLNSADYQLNKQPEDISYLLKETAADNYDLIEEREIELVLDLPEEPLVYRIDKREMKRVFSNLMINACKHNPPGTKLLIAIRQEKGSPVIVFADNGTPIPATERERMFEPFVSENETERNFNGSGLGLAITKTIVEKHGFTIELRQDNDEYQKKFVIRLAE